jgi:hypothetical protein
MVGGEEKDFMKSNRTGEMAGVLTILALVSAACSGGGILVSTGTRDADALDAVEQAEQAEEDPDVMEQAGDEVVEDTPADETDEEAQDVAEDEAEGGLCGRQPALPECTEVSPAPTEPAGIEEFAGRSAIPLKCLDEDGTWRWEFDVLRDSFEDHVLFMMGEVHGSVEIGEASADLFQSMVEEGAVDELAMEIAVDTTEAMNDYIQTGAGELVSVYGFNDWPDSVFWRTLVERARELFLAGTTVRAFGVDTPWRMAWINEQIEAMAGALVLTTLPPPVEFGQWVDSAYVDQAEAYAAHIAASAGTLCAELTGEDCERLQQLAEALYLSAFYSSMEFYTAPARVIDEWFARREAFIFYNYRTMTDWDGVRVYTHMGSAHTAKMEGQVASWLDGDFEPTMDAVYTLTPAFGSGSAIMYAGYVFDLDPEPSLVAAALETMPVDSYFLAAAHPGEGCVGNPLLAMPVSDLGGFYGVSYDGLFWFRRLTPDRSARSGREGLGPLGQAVLEMWERMQAADGSVRGGTLGDGVSR